MIVYLQRNFAEEGNEGSHWFRNTLLTGGALIGGHYASKGGLFGAKAQKWSGNLHTKFGNWLGSKDMAESGMKAAATGHAKITAGDKWGDMSEAARTSAINSAMKHKDVVQYVPVPAKKD